MSDQLTALFLTLGILNLGLAASVVAQAWKDPDDSLGRLLHRAAGLVRLTKPYSPSTIRKESES